MNVRSEQQFKLQQTLEAISIFAYKAKGAREFIPELNIALTTGTAAPNSVLLVIVFVSRISRKVHQKQP